MDIREYKPIQHKTAKKRRKRSFILSTAFEFDFPFSLNFFFYFQFSIFTASFTLEQLQNANSNRKTSFTVSKNGDKILYVSHLHGIWLTFDQYGDARLGISSQYHSRVDGLCGFFNNDKIDDKRTPIGQLANSTAEFGAAWSVSGGSDSDCEPHVCPSTLQDVAWKICNQVNDDVFKPCHASVDPTKFMSSCLETACECLLTASNGSHHSPATKSELEKLATSCKCPMLKNYAVECLATDETLQLDTWRSATSCEIKCPSPRVHHDCFRRKCEPTCNNIQAADCNIVPGTCFSGCYCPSGTIRQGENCIPIGECRDCVCDGFGRSQYLTYDRKNFTFDGNCTYLLTRNVMLENVHTFEIYATIGACNPNSTKKSTCTQAFHIAYGSHIVHMQKSPSSTSFDVIIDGLRVKNYPFNQDWMRLNEQAGELKILLPQSQVEITSRFSTMTFNVSEFLQCAECRLLLLPFFPHSHELFCIKLLSFPLQFRTDKSSKCEIRQQNGRNLWQLQWKPGGNLKKTFHLLSSAAELLLLFACVMRRRLFISHP